jgi:outer membrane receptor protein involved in Fe transport
MKIERSRAVIGGAAALCLACSAVPGTLLAQDQMDDSENVLEEVYVTATKRDERLIDVPMAVTALQGQGLIDRNLLQIEQFADQVPGLLVQSFGNRATRIILRGLNSGGAGATVASVIDEATLSYSSSTSNGAIDIANLDTYDLARIEVLRGPQGTLYGAAAEGGLIKYVTNAPKLDEFEGDVEAGLETIEQGGTGFTGRAMFNVPLADNAAFRFTGFYKDIPGYIDNNLLGSKNQNTGERYGGRAQLLWQATDNFSVRLMALMQDQSYDDPGSVELVGNPLAQDVRTPDEFDIAHGGDLQWNTLNPSISDNEIRLYYLTLNWENDKINVLSNTSYGEVNSTFRQDITYADAAPGVPVPLGLAFAFAYGVPFIAIYGDQTNDLGKFNQEIRVSNKDTVEAGSMGIDWQVGAFYSDEDITFDQFYDALDPVTGEVLLTDIFAPLGYPQLPTGGSTLPANYKEVSGFGEIVLHFNDQFKVAVGGRYSSNRQWSQVTNKAGLITAPVDIVNPIIRSDETKFTWSIAPTFNFADNQMVYARVATGYRPGGPALIIPGAPPDFPLSYKSDSTVNYELGTKGATQDGRFTWDLAAFYIDWTDIQVLTQFVSESSGVTYTITGNAGTARSKGLEWNLGWEATDQLMFTVNGAYVDAKLTEDARGLGGYDGDQLPFVPEWTNTVNADYTVDFGDVPVTFGVTWRYVGKRYTGFGAPASPDADRGPGSHVELPDYHTFAAQIIATYDRWRFRVYGQNLTDERALTAYSPGSGYNLTGFGQIIQPRTFGFSVGLSF